MGFPIPLTQNFDILESYGRKLLQNSDSLVFDSYNKFIFDIKKLKISGQILWMLINVEKFKRHYFGRKWRY